MSIIYNWMQSGPDGGLAQDSGGECLECLPWTCLWEIVRILPSPGPVGYSFDLICINNAIVICYVPHINVIWYRVNITQPEIRNLIYIDIWFAWITFVNQTLFQRFRETRGRWRLEMSRAWAPGLWNVGESWLRVRANNNRRAAVTISRVMK